MLASDTEDSFLLFAIAKEYEKVQDFAMTIQWLEQLKRKDPSYGGLYYHLALAYNELVEHTMAMAVCDSGIEVLKASNNIHLLKELENLRFNLELDGI